MYFLISVSSYFAGVLCYIGALKLLYNQGMGSDTHLIWVWIGFPFFFFVIPIYIAIIIFLRLIRRPSLFLQTFIFLIPGFFAMGGAFFPQGLSLLLNPLSKEASLFYCCYTATAFIFSFGSWYTERWLASTNRGRQK